MPPPLEDDAVAMPDEALLAADDDPAAPLLPVDALDVLAALEDTCALEDTAAEVDVACDDELPNADDEDDEDADGDDDEPSDWAELITVLPELPVPPAACVTHRPASTSHTLPRSQSGVVWQ